MAEDGNGISSSSVSTMHRYAFFFVKHSRGGLCHPMATPSTPRLGGMDKGWARGGHGVAQILVGVAEVAGGVALATPSATPVTPSTPSETSIIGMPQNY